MLHLKLKLLKSGQFACFIDSFVLRQIYTHVHVQNDTPTHGCTHAHTRTHAHARTCMHTCTHAHTRAHTHTFARYSQVELLWVDTGRSQHLPLSHLFSLPPQLSISVIPPLSIPTQLGAVVSTHGDGQNWFPLDNQLLWKHIHHKTVSCGCIH